MLNDDMTQSGEMRRQLGGVDRSSGMTPMDLRQAKFGSSVRGYDRTEVSTMLTEAADSFEYALLENDRLRQELTRLDTALQQFRELERSLKNTLLSAQKVADDMRDSATQDAGRILREADARGQQITTDADAKAQEMLREVEERASNITRDAETRAQAIVEKAEERRNDIDRDLTSLKMRRRDAETNVEATIATLRNALETLREQARPDDRMVVPRAAA